jgi:hypothetical protein
MMVGVVVVLVAMVVAPATPVLGNDFVGGLRGVFNDGGWLNGNNDCPEVTHHGDLQQNGNVVIDNSKTVTVGRNINVGGISCNAF